ncbi:MAG: hypothetical protein AB7T22_05435 [Calditrichaceae bacterium]
MKSLKIRQKWMEELMPSGIPVPSSTLISGPGGAGKPLIGAVIADAWLNQGGSLIHFLINFDRVYADKMLNLFNPDLEKYKDRIVYVEIDPLIEGIEKTNDVTLRGNLLIPENVDTAIREAKAMLPETESGSLIYASALNMLLFSKSYNQAIHDKFLEIIGGGENCMFTVATNTFEDQISQWENKADNLFYSRSTDQMRLGFSILRLKDNSYRSDEVEVPLTEDELVSIRAEANKARKHLIPVIKQI